MQTKRLANTVIEPEILDEQGQVIVQADTKRTDPKVGAWTGFVALIFSFMMLLLGTILTVCIIAPILLLGRLLGLQIRSLKK